MQKWSKRSVICIGYEVDSDAGHKKQELHERIKILHVSIEIANESKTVLSRKNQIAGILPLPLLYLWRLQNHESVESIGNCRWR